MNLKESFARYIPEIEAEMRECLSTSEPALTGYYGMLHYHLGWANEHFQPIQVSSGKRIRPMLCLLACQAAQGDPTQAVPAAAGIELLHNFSLIHDDIEDKSQTRRGRPSVWALWDIPQAINSGDGLSDERETIFRQRVGHTSTHPPQRMQRLPSKTGVTPQSRQRDASRTAASSPRHFSAIACGFFNRSSASSAASSTRLISS